MPLKDIVTVVLGLRALTWAVFMALQNYYEKEKQTMVRPVLNSCIRQVGDFIGANPLWVSETERHVPDFDGLIRRFQEHLKNMQVAFVPDLDLFNQIWLVKGEISGSFAVAFVFLIYGSGFSVICPEQQCTLVTFHVSVGTILLHTGLILSVITFVYALSFSARLQLRKAIMDLTLWELWKNHPRSE